MWECSGDLVDRQMRHATETVRSTVFVSSHDSAETAWRHRLLVELISNINDENGAMK